MNADILIRHHNMILDLNIEKQHLADIRNKDIHMLVNPIFLEDNKAQAKIKLVCNHEIPGSSATVVLQANFFCSSDANASASIRKDSIPESLVTFLLPCRRSVNN